MSLDIYLKEPPCPHCGSVSWTHSQNITHNLGNMAKEAGIYGILWRPEENGITAAGQLVEPLRKGIYDMVSRPEHYEQFNSPNGWGLYKHFLPWLEELLAAAEAHPNATVEASR